MKMDIEFKTLLLKLVFCRDSRSYITYINALLETKSIQSLIAYVLNKVNVSKNINITLADQLSFDMSNDDPDMLDIYINIENKNININQIMVPINLNKIDESPDWILLFPGEEEIKL